MNLILFDAPFETVRLEGRDPRAEHLRKVLRVRPGALVYLGFVNGPRARARVAGLAADGGLTLEVTGTEPAPPPLPIRLLAGLPRPHTAKRILFEAAALGVEALHFFEAERGEPSYGRSSLWSTEAWTERLRLGAEQSFGTHLPEVAVHPDLQSALTAHCEAPLRIALDHYEAEGPLAPAVAGRAGPAVLALGPERGWSPSERDALRRNGWRLAHLGPRVLRSEAAAVAATALAAAGLEAWSSQTETALNP